MRAAVVREFGGPEVIEIVEVATPEPGPGEVLVKVAGASVNFADVMTRTGLTVQYGATGPREQFGLGADVAGTVAALGEGVTKFAVGDAVVGTQERLDRPWGTQADYVVLEDWELAPAPRGTDLVQLAAFGLNATTADQALDALALEPGQWLLVSGAAGGVGLLTVELARLRGLKVIAQAGPADEKLVLQAGAQLFVSRDDDLVPTVRRLVPGGVDGAVDAANLAAGAADAVRHGGAFVSLLNSAPQARREVRMTNLAWHTDAERLAKLAAYAGAGLISLRVAKTYSLKQIAEAHRALAEGGLRGRIVLVPDQE
ncbi:NADP-dependent oxidoreductase [Streptomyces turgidiscabies]|uniref:Oxidoreductase, zinc-binding dehydrogenase family protein n=1 Tax=Streptomyces turgidiscabies (strain Car8) TaxID=698760 RepID=L7FHX4_STRT8|nr:MULTISPECIES: NADP-dependent oxidoreductase [Streptomyces]ELP70932.1 oxidoreductase, zinc-binding dehydrogenase family protein [Streptomyces turgidiscabies Car8]MDX3494868.1 NADP-dependent oxidoreductase [Streptomyces turgidiscabies]GAQ71483.1 quinone oxidoreductase 1 [Streptomyces turgidiscabies]